MAIKSLTANLMVSDVSRSADFWCDRLGFRLALCADEGRNFHKERPRGVPLVWAQFLAGEVELMVQRGDNLALDVPGFAGRSPGGALTLYLQVDDLDDRHARLKGVLPTVKDLATTHYGMREWYVEDPDGYVVCLAQPV